MGAENVAVSASSYGYVRRYSRVCAFSPEQSLVSLLNNLQHPVGRAPLCQRRRQDVRRLPLYLLPVGLALHLTK